jgi:RNA polymerase sigma-70 factor (sigma-E family)
VDEQTRRDFGEFVAARSPALLRLAYVLAGDQEAAEDLLQSALTKAAAHWGRIHGAPEGYVRRIMYREQVGLWRRRARRPEIAMAQGPELPARDEVAGVEARLALREALLALPSGKRVMLVLRYLEDLSETQVADILGCSVGTVRSQTHKAIAQLRAVVPSLNPANTEVSK